MLTPDQLFPPLDQVPAPPFHVAVTIAPVKYTGPVSALTL